MEKRLRDGDEMAHGVDAIRKWQTADDIICITNKDGSIDEIPITRVPNTEFPRLMKLGMKFQSAPKEVTEQDFKVFIDLMVTAIMNANQGVTHEEVRNFVITRFTDVSKSFMEVNGGNVSIDEIPADIKEALGV
jgi:hypothetical protein